MKEIRLQFKGYRREEKKEDIENISGVYCVYRCEYDSEDKTVNIKQLLYIGESEDIGYRINHHDHLRQWKKYLKRGETLCYSRAKVVEEDRERAEAALIYHHQPICNDKGKDSFNYDDTKIYAVGEHKYIDSEFEVEKTVEG